MHHKLTFLRNPRHPLPPAVKNLMGLRPETNRWVGPRTEVRARELRAPRSAHTALCAPAAAASGLRVYQAWAAGLCGLGPAGCCAAREAG
jgi:hypothetical protein